ncbi:MAG TPA: tetratricopeptide repeat protein [Candidatus Paceibacterota bacterium]
MEEQAEQTNSRFHFDFGKVFERCLFGVTLLLPIIFIPSPSVSLYSAKVALLAVVAVLFLGTFLAMTLSRGIISFPKSKFLIPIAVFPVVYFLASFFSGQPIKSIVGQVFELGTSGSILMLTMLLFVAMFSLREKVDNGIRFFNLLFVSAGVVIAHLFVRILAIGGVLPESIGSRIPNFVLGGAIDTAIFLGMVCVVLIAALNMWIAGKARYLAYAFMAISIAFVAASGFLPVVIVLGLFALVYFVYTFSWSVSGDHEMKKASFPSLFVLSACVVVLLSGSSLSGFLSNAFKINSVEVRPNLDTTVEMIGQAWQVNPILGVGPNMFKEFWDLKRPVDINVTQFWGAEFNFGSGFIPTVAITTGILGTVTILAFLFLYARAGFKAIFYTGPDLRYRQVSSTAFFSSLFLWVMAFVYVPSISLIGLAFILSGVFAGSLVSQGVVEQKTINIFRNPKANFAAVFSIIILLISSIAFGYFVIERVVATSFFNKGDVNKAIQIAPTDLYWRRVAELSLSEIGSIVSTVSSVENLNESQRIAVQNAVTGAIEGSRQAIAWNSKNYQNWFALGRVYEVLGANGISGAVENANVAYIEAQNRSPQNPAIPLAFARLKALSGDIGGARENIGKAIQLKNNYTDAYFTLAQLEVASNNIQGAIDSVEAATFIDSGNAVLYFQLGLLKYNNRDFAGAAKAFERAVELINDYANARYFLGLSYENLGRDIDAIAQFEEIQKTNPDNAEVVLILDNLRAGKSPFSNAEPPIDAEPEKRPEPPIEEN